MPVIPDPSPGVANTGSAAARECAWLAETGDGLPSLQTEDGGPWDVLQAYWPGAHFAKDKSGLYVDALKVDDLRVSNLRVRPQYQITLTLIWPVKGRGATAGSSATARIPETEQQNLDSAAALVIERVRGFVGDKTHGGRFLSVAENPRTVSYVKQDPAVTVPLRELRATIMYKCDDYEVNG